MSLFGPSFTDAGMQLTAGINVAFKANQTSDYKKLLMIPDMNESPVSSCVVC